MIGLKVGLDYRSAPVMVFLRFSILLHLLGRYTARYLSSFPVCLLFHHHSTRRLSGCHTILPTQTFHGLEPHLLTKPRSTSRNRTCLLLWARICTLQNGLSTIAVKTVRLPYVERFSLASCIPFPPPQHCIPTLACFLSRRWF